MYVHAQYKCSVLVCPRLSPTRHCYLALQELQASPTVIQCPQHIRDHDRGSRALRTHTWHCTLQYTTGTLKY